MGHLIHRQILELKFASQEDARRWSPRISELNRRLVLAELDRVFTELSPTQNLRIERLEIDLGRVRLADLENDLQAVLGDKLREALQPYVKDASRASPQAEVESEQMPTLSGGAKTQDKEVLLDAETLHEIFTSFLQTGQFPWWLRSEYFRQLNQLYQDYWQQAPTAARNLVLQTIATPVGLLRFIEQFSNRSHQLTLQNLLPPVTGDLLVDLRKLATHLLARQGFGLKSRIVSYKLIYSLIAVSRQAQLERPELLMRQFFYTLAQLSGIPTTDLPTAVDTAIARLRLLPATLAIVAELLRDQQTLASRQQFDQRQLEEAFQEPVERSGCRVEAPEGVEIALENAGLVLLWPHLGEFLRKLKLLEVMADGSTKPKVEAALLLQQLVDGQPAGPENLLALNKLLCGIPLAIPLPRRLRRQQQWDRQVDALLSAVIHQWSALKNTSNTGLRSGFLQRQGVLREQGDGWLLQVERKSHDILLEQLPWGIGVIRFSWMKQPLQVEW